MSFFVLIIRSQATNCKLPIRRKIYNCTFKNRNKVSIIIIFICLFTDLFFDAVNDYVGFGLMDAKKMVDLAVKWKRVPTNVTCTIPRRGVNR